MTDKQQSGSSRRNFLKYASVAAGAVSLGAATDAGATAAASAATGAAATPATVRVAADPTAIPKPIRRKRAAEVDVVLEAREVLA